MRSVQTIYLSIKMKKNVLLLFNKPRGIVCSTKQQFDETTVTDYLDYPLRVYPVGRLDKESQGLLLLTNEGDLVNKIMRAGNYHEKEYFVTVNKPVDREFVRRMSKGVPVLDTVTETMQSGADRRMQLSDHSDTGTEPADPQNVPVSGI